MEAYDIVQEASLVAHKTKKGLKDLLLKNDKMSRYMSQGEIEDCFSLEYHLRHIDKIFKNIGL
jgi:adenylosuccinate lyase